MPVWSSIDDMTAGLALFMIMVMIMVISMAMMVMMVVLAVRMIVPGMARVRFDRTPSLPAPEDGDELRRQQPSADQRNQRVAHHFELIRPGIDLEARGIQRKCQDADERDRRQRLQPCGDEGDDNAAPHRLLIGDDIRRDDHLAVTGADGVHDAIEEGESGKHHRAGKRIVAFEALDPGRKLTLHALLRAQHPAEDAAEGARRLLRGAWGGEPACAGRGGGAGCS